MQERSGPQDTEKLNSLQEMLILSLIDSGVVKFGDYKTKIHTEYPGAPLFPMYINLRMLRRLPEEKYHAVSAYQSVMRRTGFDLVADIPTAVTPLVSSLVDRIGAAQITPRLDSKSYGSGQKVDGMLEEDKGKVAVLVDDVITLGGSKLEAAEILREEGIIVRDVVVLVDYEIGGKEELERHDLKLHSAFTVKQMLDLYLKSKKIPQQRYVDAINRLEEIKRHISKS